MDITTIVGLIAGFTLIVMGILNGGQLSAFIDTPSLLITLGGTVAGTLINHPLQQMVGLVSVGMKAFWLSNRPVRKSTMPSCRPGFVLPSTEPSLS